MSNQALGVTEGNNGRGKWQTAIPAALGPFRGLDGMAPAKRGGGEARGHSQYTRLQTATDASWHDSIMDPAQITGLITGLTGLVAAIGALVALFRHQTGPAHSTPPAAPPAAPPPPG